MKLKETEKYKNLVNVDVVKAKESLCINCDCTKEWNGLFYPENSVLLITEWEISQDAPDVKERELD